MISNKNVFKIVIASWIFITFFYVLHTSPDQRTADFSGHLEYTEIIVKEKRFPLPYEKWETYHPPLYYYINSFFAPNSFNTDKSIHINYVRAMSVIYGAIALAIIIWFLQQNNINPIAQILVTFYIFTTPLFVYIFSTYNNDSLANLVSIAILAIGDKLYKQWSFKNGLLLLLVTTIGLYTKFTLVFCMSVVLLLCLRNLLKFKLPSANEAKIIGIFALSFILLLFWLLGHNYKYTGKIFPHNAEQGLPGQRIDEDRSILEIISPLAILQSDPHKWDDPFTHPYKELSTKRHDYWAWTWITSVISGEIYKSPSVQIIWAMLWIHFIAFIIALMNYAKSFETRLSLLVILLGHFVHITLIVLFARHSCAMEYRYLCWLNMPWALLYANALSDKNSLSYKVLSRLLIVGFVLQVYFLMTVVT